jgi:hypothetical protein
MLFFPSVQFFGDSLIYFYFVTGTTLSTEPKTVKQKRGSNSVGSVKEMWRFLFATRKSLFSSRSQVLLVVASG